MKFVHRCIIIQFIGMPNDYVCWYIRRTLRPYCSFWTWLSLLYVLLGIFLGWENLNFRTMNCWTSWVRLFLSCPVMILGTVAHLTTYRSNNVRNGISSKVWGCCQYIARNTLLRIVSGWKPANGIFSQHLAFKTSTMHPHMTRVMSICRPYIMCQERTKKKRPNTFWKQRMELPPVVSSNHIIYCTIPPCFSSIR